MVEREEHTQMTYIWRLSVYDVPRILGKKICCFIFYTMHTYKYRRNNIEPRTYVGLVERYILNRWRHAAEKGWGRGP